MTAPRTPERAALFFVRIGRWETVMDEALCLNCGKLVPHRRGGHVVMCFRPVADRADYIVTIDGAEVHRCTGPTQAEMLRYSPDPQPFVAAGR